MTREDTIYTLYKLSCKTDLHQQCLPMKHSEGSKIKQTSREMRIVFHSTNIRLSHFMGKCAMSQKGFSLLLTINTSKENIVVQ